MTATEYLQTLRAKPHHVRERIALGASLGVTLVVALVWAATLSVTGAFSLKSQPAQGPFLTQLTPTAAAAQGQSTNLGQLLGAVGAAGASSTEPALTVEDQGSTSTLDRQTQPEATVVTY